MRKTQQMYKNGEERITSFFAWLPVEAKNTDKKIAETRWLEKVTVRQKFVIDWLEGDHHFQNIEFL